MQASLPSLKYRSSFLLNLFVAWLTGSIISDHLGFSLLMLTYLSLFQKIYNYTQLNHYGTHHDPFTCWIFCLVDHFKRIIHYSLVSLLIIFSVTSYLKRIKLFFVNKNVYLSYCRKHSFLYCYLKEIKSPSKIQHCTFIIVITSKYALLMTQTNNGFEQPFFCLVLVNKYLTIMIFEILNIFYFENKDYSDVSLKHFF